ncbi:type I restriction-modification system subunit M [Patescibacteria group bacterium]|nr:type I restriction-modification system subunit M [Patescibacteria group bacterium]
MSIDKSQFITPTQLAKVLGISRVAVHQKIKKGEIKADDISVSSKASFLIPVKNLSKEVQERIKKEQKKATKSVLKKNKDHRHDLDFEKDLWEAADKLRGNIDVSEYKHIVLGLLFLKYISDAFYKRREELESLTRDKKNSDYYVENEEARKQILDTKDFYTSIGVFYVPEKSRWEYLQTKIMSSDVGKVLDTAMDLIEKENLAQLEGVLPKIYTKTHLDSSVIGELINIFSRITFDHDFDKEKDILGRIYEYFLGQFASSEGKRGGEFFSPRSLVKVLVEVLEPYENARVLDPACGSGGMFVSMGQYLDDHGMDPSKLAISGQESNTTTLRLCKMNMAIRGLSGKIELGNTYYQDKFPNLKADFVLANPPFNADWEPSKLSDNDPRMILGTAPSSNANFTWIQHFIHHLAPNGYAGFVMANGALGVSGKEGELRKNLIEQDLVDVIISCPSKLFYNVGLPVSLWFIAKNKEGDRFRNRKGETLFIDARDLFEQISRKQVVFTDEHIDKISGIVRSWRGEKGTGEYKDISGFCKSANLEEIDKKGFVLTPQRYIGLSEEEDDGIPFEEKMEKLSDKLKEAFKSGRDLEKQIENNLKELGF